MENYYALCYNIVNQVKYLHFTEYALKRVAKKGG